MNAIQRLGLALAVLAVAGIAIVLGCGGTSGSDKIVLRYANFPPAATFPGVQMEHWKAELEKATNNKVDVQMFHGSTLLKAKDIFDGVVSGQADIGCFAMSYQPGKFPVSEAVDQPLGFTSARQASLVLFDLMAKRQPKEFEKVKVITYFACPPTSIMSVTPIRSLADLKGMSIRSSGTASDALKALGANPVGMPQSEIPENLQKGVIKGIASSLEVLKDMGYSDLCKYATKTELPVVSFAVVMNKKKWESLPDDVKKAIDDLARQQCIWTAQYVDKHQADVVAQAQKDGKLEVFTLSDADRASVQTALQPMVTAYIQRANKAGLDGEGIIKDIEDLKAKHADTGSTSAPASTPASGSAK